jgi:hypothetical protein
MRCLNLAHDVGQPCVIFVFLLASTSRLQVLDGHGRATVEGEELELGPGDVVFAALGEPRLPPPFHIHNYVHAHF